MSIGSHIYSSDHPEQNAHSAGTRHGNTCLSARAAFSSTNDCSQELEMRNRNLEVGVRNRETNDDMKTGTETLSRHHSPLSIIVFVF